MPALTLSTRSLRERDLMRFALELAARRSADACIVTHDAAEIIALRRRIHRLGERLCNEKHGEDSPLDRALDRWLERLKELALAYNLRVEYPGLWPMLVEPDGRAFYCPC